MFKVFHGQVSPYHPDLNRYWLDDFQKVVEDGRNGLLDPSLPTLDELVHGLNKCRLQGNRDNALLVHMIMCKNGLESSTALGSALVSSLVELGSIQDACQVFNKLTSPNEQAWNSLILGFLDRGNLQDAFTLYKKLRKEKIPIYNGPILVALLKDCISCKDAAKGEEIHNHVAETGQLKEDAFICCTLVDMYMKCGFPSKAQEVFDKVQVQNVVMWNALISGYVGNGSDEDAVISFRQMLANGIVPNAITFVCILKALAVRGTVDKVVEIHVEIERRGLLQRNVFVGSTLVDAYAKCGWLTKAHEVFVKLQTRDVVSWTALISGHCEHGHGEAALDCFDQMQLEDVLPNAATYACSLKACACAGAVDKGREIHDEIAKQGFLKKDLVLGNAVVDMYCKCNALSQAQQVLEELPARDAISWNALIAGYVRQGQDEQALNCLEQMQREGLCPDTVTFTCILKVCGRMGASDKGEQIHDEIAQRGLLRTDMVLGNAVVDMYAKCGALTKAREVLLKLPVRDVVSWNALIAGCAQKGKSEQALQCYEQMQEEGHSPNAMTFTCILKASGDIKSADVGEKFHEEIVRRGLLGEDIVLGNALVYMYTKCGALAKALQVLEALPVRDSTSWNALITGYAQRGGGEQALNCYDEMQHEGLPPDPITYASILKACGSIQAADKGGEIHDAITRRGLLGKDVVLGNALVDMYAKCGALGKARQVLEELPVREITTWNALLTGYAQLHEGLQALGCLQQIHCDGLSPDAVTFACVLKACGSIGAADKGQEVHDAVVRQGLLENCVVLGNALINMNAKCGALVQAQQVLEGLPVRGVISWNELIAGYAQQGQGQQALHYFEQMKREGVSPNAMTYVCLLKACGCLGGAKEGERIHDEIVRGGLLEHNAILGNALVVMYVKCGSLMKAQEVLEQLPKRDAVSWSALISGYVQQGNGEQALECFGRMQNEDLSPDAVTFVCLLKACSAIGARNKGVQIHEEIARLGLLVNNYVLGSAMVDMYSKCGSPKQAQGVLDELHLRDVVSWSTIIGGYAEQGSSEQALKCLKQMHCEGLSPNAITFSCVLNACGRAGLVDDAQMYFVTMSRAYGIMPDVQHWAFMIDLFGRTGHLDKALELMQKVSFSDVPAAVWSALLGACSRWGDPRVGRWAFEQALQVDKEGATNYALLANAYAVAGMQGTALSLEALV